MLRSKPTNHARVDASQIQKQVMSKLWREMERPGNQNCADCDESDPEWASVNLGILLCAKCAGVHRSLGVHISTVRSITLDEWDQEQLTNLHNVGNRASNLLYEHTLPVGIKPTSISSPETRAAYIHSKYIEKAYMHGVTSYTPTDKGSQSDRQPQDSSIPLRFVDYFLVFGRGTRLPDLTFEPKLIDRLPLNDHPDFTLSTESIMPFVFTEEIALSPINLPPTRVSFTLTSAIGIRQYAVGIQFWEVVPPMEIIELQANASTRNGDFRNNRRLIPSANSDRSVFEENLYSPKCILLISHWPFLNTYEHWLSMLYRISLSSAPLPLERFIANFIFEVPIPPAGKVAVQFSIANETLRITRPPPNSLPLCDCRMLTLFQCLDLNNIMVLITALLTEQRIVLCSSQRSALVDVCEAATALIFPLTWQGVYMPVLPRRLCEFIHAPVPFIAGIASPFLLAPNPIIIPPEVVFLNLDTNEVMMPEQDTLPAFGAKPLRKLLASLQLLVSGHTFPSRDEIDLVFPYSEHTVEINEFGDAGLIVSEIVASPTTRTDTTKQLLSRLKRGSPAKSKRSKRMVPERTRPPSMFDTEAIRELFLRFMVKLLGHYRQFLIPLGPSYMGDSRVDDDRDCLVLFDRSAALRDAPEAFRAVLAVLTETQMFERFIRDRWTPDCQPALDAASDVLFFDENIVAKMNRSNFHLNRATPFLDDTSHEIVTTFVVPFPNRTGINREVFDYTYFPRLRPELIGIIRKVDPLVTTERRQVASTLARRVNSDLMKGRVAPPFQSWERLRRAAVVIQSRYRGFKPRCRYLSLKRQTQFVQDHRQFLRLKRGTSLLQCAFRMYMNRVHRAFMLCAAASSELTGVFQAYLAVKHREKLHIAVEILSASLTGYVARANHRRLLDIWIKIQAKVRMQIARRRYLWQMSLIILTQAHVRAIRVRRHQACVIAEGIDSCRTKLSELWTWLSSALNYRSQFWLVLQKPSYMSWMMHIEEVHRLQDELRDRSAETAARMSKNLLQERHLLYTTMAKTLSRAAREKLFAQFGLKGRLRKQRLSKLLWDLPGQEDLSARAVQFIFENVPAIDMNLIASKKRKRIEINLHNTTMSSLRAVSRLHHRVAVLRTETALAFNTNARLSIRNQLLLQQARSMVKPRQAFPSQRPPVSY